MPQVLGSIKTESLITIFVPRNHVMSAKDKRYVFMALVQPQVFEVSKRMTNGRKLYNNFVRATRNNLYNTVKIYGLEAIDIDTPQTILVSARLQFKIVRDENSVEQNTVRDIKKKM
jgi:hypothetical protein